VIRRKAQYTNFRNFHEHWNLSIPLQTKTITMKIKRTVTSFIKKLNAPAPIKEYISNHTKIYFQPTKKIIDTLRMDRKLADTITLDHIKTSRLNDPFPCKCNERPHSSNNKTHHTFIRTDRQTTSYNIAQISNNSSIF